MITAQQHYAVSAKETVIMPHNVRLDYHVLKEKLEILIKYLAVLEKLLVLRITAMTLRIYEYLIMVETHILGSL